MTKYGARRVEIDGIKFASKAEGDRYLQLREMVDNQEIDGFVKQPKYLFEINGIPLLGYKQCRQMGYVGDFAYLKDGIEICEDVKGFVTPDFKIKFSLARALYPNIEFYLFQKRRGLFKPEDKK